MIKKIIFILLLFSIVISCGKKQDPKYEGSKKDTLQNIILKDKA